MSLNNTTSKGKHQNTHLRTAGVVQACHNFLVSQTGFQQPGFWITMAGFRIPRTKITWIPDSGLPYMGRYLALTEFLKNLFTRE